jgi:hypothetical protein
VFWGNSLNKILSSLTPSASPSPTLYNALGQTTFS